MAQQDHPRAHARECFASTPVAFSSVHESCVDSERDVVQEEAVVCAPDVHMLLDTVECPQRGNWLVAVEAEVACEVVPRSERDADEGGVPFERNLSDRGE